MSGQKENESVISQLLFWLADWSVLMAFWCALYGEFRMADLAIGAAAALVGSILSVLTESMNVARFAPHGRYLWASRSLLVQVPLGVVQVLRLLVSDGTNSKGGFYVTKFNPGGDDASSQARRAVAETMPTMSPTSIILDIDRKRGLAIFHLLGTSSVPPTVQRLGEME